MKAQEKAKGNKNFPQDHSKPKVCDDYKRQMADFRSIYQKGNG